MRWTSLVQLGNTCTAFKNRWLGLPIHALRAHHIQYSLNASRSLSSLTSIYRAIGGGVYGKSAPTARARQVHNRNGDEFPLLLASTPKPRISCTFWSGRILVIGAKQGKGKAFADTDA